MVVYIRATLKPVHLLEALVPSNKEMVDFIVNQIGDRTTTVLANSLYKIVAKGNHALVERALSCGALPGSVELEITAERGHSHLLQYFDSIGFSDPPRGFVHAAANSHVDCAQWVLDHGARNFVEARERCRMYQNKEMEQWVGEQQRRMSAQN
jgi:hypothetical protein